MTLALFLQNANSSLIKIFQIFQRNWLKGYWKKEHRTAFICYDFAVLLSKGIWICPHNLQHQSQIRKWYSKIPGGPGFTEPAFQALDVCMHQAQEQNKQIVCALMFDEMEIRKFLGMENLKLIFRNQFALMSKTGFSTPSNFRFCFKIFSIFCLRWQIIVCLYCLKYV